MKTLTSFTQDLTRLNSTSEAKHEQSQTQHFQRLTFLSQTFQAWKLLCLESLVQRVNANQNVNLRKPVNEDSNHEFIYKWFKLLNRLDCMVETVDEENNSSCDIEDAQVFKAFNFLVVALQKAKQMLLTLINAQKLSSYLRFQFLLLAQGKHTPRDSRKLR